MSLINGAYREIHREQLSIEHSMRDLDSAVGRLDNILMSLYFIIVILIFAVALVSPFPMADALVNSTDVSLGSASSHPDHQCWNTRPW